MPSMHFVDRSTTQSLDKVSLTLGIGLVAAGVILPAFLPGVLAQTTPLSAPPAMASRASPTAQAAVARPFWIDLTESQRGTLQPLASSWDAMDAIRKRKWLSLAQTYANLTPAEQAKLQSRMAEWAALSPHERTLARLNFAESKKVAPNERAANWDAYQALSEEDRRKFAHQANGKPRGAAVAAKPIAENKVTPVPITRHTPAPSASSPSTPIDRKTLLPQQPARPSVAVPAPTTN